MKSTRSVNQGAGMVWPHSFITTFLNLDQGRSENTIIKPIKYFLSTLEL